MELGVCYYPEQWPPEWWADDAKRMREMGICWVRIAEFAWSVIEPAPGRLEWAWLDRAIETLHAEGLKVVLGTPTATPPKWLVDAHPEILAIDALGAPRGFGSRRHYCFSSPVYREQSARIVRLMAERYGHHAAVAAWQTDNEYGCHDTVLSYSPAARAAFRVWLAARYPSIEALNRAWGTVFWSQCYGSFEAIDPPVGTVTEANPAQRLDYRRFASDEVVAYNRAQVQVIRALSPGRPVAHNYMGFFTEFDHHAVSRDLDIASWDSYPIGFTQDRAGLSDAEKRRWMRTGHPDIPAFHHDLYRGMCGGRWWVMEQQPGPVNWAPWNPAPEDGMVRVWTWQAFAHGAEVVSYFRWRQVRFAQEQMHAGLNRPDRTVDQGGIEATQVGEELQRLGLTINLSGLRGPRVAPSAAPRVALLFDYESHWIGQTQPQGADYSVLHECFRAYSALRGMALDVDVLPSTASLAGYALIVLPAQLHVSEALAAALSASEAHVVVGARSGSKTAHLSITKPLPPGRLAELLGLTVLRVESLPPGVVETAALADGHGELQLQRWRERLACTSAQVEARYADGSTALARHGRLRYLAGSPEVTGWSKVLARAAADAGLVTQPLDDGLRVSRIGSLAIACNFSDQALDWAPAEPATALLGERKLAPRGVSVWQMSKP
jgi:beta-galactosidase